MKKRYVNGILCCSIGDAAKYLGTNAKGIQNFIDSTQIKFETNGKINSSRIHLHVSDLIQVKHGKKSQRSQA